MIKKNYLFFPALVLALVLSLVFSFEGQINAASPTSNSVQDLKIDTVDGVKYSPDEHKKIAGIVVEKTNQGERVLGFSTSQKYEAYHQQAKELSPNADVGILSGTDYFFEHANRGGRFVRLSSGTNVWATGVRWGSFWNDRFSSLSVAPWSWVNLYEHNGYDNFMVGYRNLTSSHVWWNLPSYANDETSSIRTGNY
ncbi:MULTISPECIES: hypothetical protein [Bacillus]|uniref:Uncharacterized protein n=1 Tax=Bacillus capparidis TaxID=1840411 RepID=A0ABS4CZE3_9BACI|nr:MULTISPECIES: hypothetical protein [Bacillus]MBP1082761.1 hypothetical protein [Bacillus capparidis]MED1097024.1 hypothetical protein [Bacillus capparidis]